MSSVAFLHGLGQTADSWEPVIRALPTHLPALSIPLDLGSGWSLSAAATSTETALDEAGVERATVCGVSLGAMVGIQFAAAHPDRVERLILSGAQTHPNRALMSAQRAVMRVLPERLVSPAGVRKHDMLAVLDALSDVDLRPVLASIAVPTLILCGSRDRANLSAAHEIAATIPGAHLEIVPAAGHEWNVTHPVEFAKRVAAFMDAPE